MTRRVHRLGYSFIEEEASISAMVFALKNWAVFPDDIRCRQGIYRACGIPESDIRDWDEDARSIFMKLKEVSQ